MNFFLLLVLSILAQLSSTEDEGMSCIVGWFYERTFMVSSSNETIAELIAEDKTTMDAFQGILDFHQYLEGERNARNDSLKCQNRGEGVNDDWNTGNIKAEAFGFGSLNKCPAEMDHFSADDREGKCDEDDNKVALDFAAKLHHEI